MRKIEFAVAGGIVVAFVVLVTAIARGAPITNLAAPASTNSADVHTLASPNSPSGPAHAPIMFGATGQYKWEIKEREKELGKHLEGVRVFRRWGQPLFAEDQIWARNTGHTIFISIKSRRPGGAKVEWRDIANAKPGSRIHQEMLRQAREIQDFGATVYVTFNHEPEARSSRPLGGPSDFVAAWRKLVDTYREASVTNARYVWVMTGQAFHGDARVAEAYYPGDGYVDHIGVDAYNWLGCRTPGNPDDGRWRSPARLLDDHRRFGAQHPGKGLMVLEWGTVEDPERPGRKAQWIRDANRLFRKPAWRQYRAVLHYDARSLDEPHSPCEWDYRTSRSAFAAWRDMGNHPAFSANSPCDISRAADELLDSLIGEADVHGTRLGPAPSRGGGSRSERVPER